MDRPFPEFSEMPKRLLVAGIIVHEGKMLLVHNIKHGLRIEPPGGKVHPGESPEDAMKREAREELGVDVSVGRLLGIYPTVSPEGVFDVHTFLCTIVDGQPELDREPEKIGHFAWMTPGEVHAACDNDKQGDLQCIVPNLQAALGDIERSFREE